VPGFIAPMLASAGTLPVGGGWAYEFKWDGVRALAVVSERATGRQASRLHLFARSGAEITVAYPELAGLVDALQSAGIDDAVLDGEVVLFDRGGYPDFLALAARMHVRDAARARSLATTQPVKYMIFDIVRANGTDLTTVCYDERRALLESLEPLQGPNTPWQVPARFSDGPATLDAATEHALEGVVAKRLSSAYRPGLRSPDWVKVKNERTGEYVIGGWRTHRRALSGLLVGLPGPNGLRYRGRVGGGISASTESTLLAMLRPLAQPHSPFAPGEVPREDTVATTWVRPDLVVEIRYGQLTHEGRLRFPRFIRLRPDKTPAEAGDA
jgi:bifunctional non-homologous end joining protein LigD